MGFSEKEYSSGLSFLSPGDLPDTGIEPGSPALQVDFLLPPEPPENPSVTEWYQYSSLSFDTSSLVI